MKKPRHSSVARWFTLCAAAAVFVASTACAETDGAPKPAEHPAESLQTLQQRASYIIGFQLGNRVPQQQYNLAPDVAARGFIDALNGNEPALSIEQINETLEAFNKYVSSKLSSLGQKNLEEGQAFLEENKSKDGVSVLPSGLQYRIIRQGTGATPGPEDTIRAHYQGTLLDGSVFDSSYKRGEPLTIAVSNVIRGWAQALQLMKEGAKWQLFVPPDLAYGTRGAGGHIGPNATLIFEIELIAVQPQEAETEAEP